MRCGTEYQKKTKRILSEAHKAKIRLAHLGKKLSADHIRKLIEGRKRCRRLSRADTVRSQTILGTGRTI